MIWCSAPTMRMFMMLFLTCRARGPVKEADVTRCKNGASVNFVEDYMRRREPDCMRIADDKPTDKKRFVDVYGYPFCRSPPRDHGLVQDPGTDPDAVQFGRQHLWLRFDAGMPQAVRVFCICAGAPAGFVNAEECEGYKPRAIVYVAPPFRHTHFEGKQVVVHNRLDDCHEVFSYNLYPGPSAKKGVYSVLLDIGEQRAG